MESLNKEEMAPLKDDNVSLLISVEEDKNWLSAYGNVKDSKGRAFYSALVTLTLGVLGSTVLPVPYAFSNCGILMGVMTMLLVAFANDCTCCMLIRAAAYTGRTSYEQLALWAGGRRAKIFTQVCLILLLYGTMCGGLAFLSDVARIMVGEGVSNAPPLLRADGRPVMVLTVLAVLLPLCLQRHIREFEKAATFGVVVVIALCVVIVRRAASAGFPAVRDGELPVFRVKWNPHLPEAFAVLGFAFYMQPMLMPLVKEMPPGPEGAAVTERAVHITLYGVACGAYGTVGVFGAAAFGSKTESNIMVNHVLDDPTATLILYAALLGYLCCGMVTTHYALRASLDELIAGPDAPFTWTRNTLETVAILSCSLAVALAFPTQAEKIFALTGCTAVCLTCYVIPVYIHVKVCHAKLACTSSSSSFSATTAAAGLASIAPAASGSTAALHEPLLGASAAAAGVFSSPLLGAQLALRDVLQCVLIISVGVGFSLAGLWVGALDLYHYLRPASTAPQ